jgi:serine phosphatase RsbU (regulator of sigma subunit)
MSRLHAIFRSLIGAGLGVSELVERANQLFAESTMRPYYATLVCGKAAKSGEMEICNAGHVAPLLLHDGGVTSIAATGLPIGMFCQERYSSTRVKLGKGDRLLLYTDGLSEARDQNDREYGDERLCMFLNRCQQLPAISLVKELLEDLGVFSLAQPRSDDLTVMAIEMVGH